MLLMNMSRPQVVKGLFNSYQVIIGLTRKLKLLLAEFAAVTRSLRPNEIVFILDELLRRKKISRKEYTENNSYLSRCL